MNALFILAAVLAFAFAISKGGRYFRDKELQVQLSNIHEVLKSPDLCIDEQIRTHWGLHAYAQRNNRISLKRKCAEPHHLLVKANTSIEGYNKTEKLSSEKYWLLQP